MSEVSEVLQAAWEKQREAIDLVHFANALIQNETEKAHWHKTLQTMRDLLFDIMRLIAHWDESPVGRRAKEVADAEVTDESGGRQQREGGDRDHADSDRGGSLPDAWTPVLLPIDD